MVDVAKDVNEGRRRREVIKEVLTGGKSTPDASAASLNGTASGLKPKKGFAVGVSASVKLVKGMKHAVRSREPADGNEEKGQVERMETELKRCEAFIRKFARETVDWAHKMKHVMTSLYAWADTFGQVIGISTDSVSEAFDAFKMVLRAQIIPVCVDLEKVVQERLLPQLSLLVDSMSDPFRLLEAMHTLEPLHYGLLNLDAPKSRPSPSLLEASQSYIALRGQLFTELPQYLKLLHKGITATIIQLSTWQTTFYNDTHAHWGELWEALRVEEDSSISCAPETMQIWWERFSVLEEALGELGILRKPKTSIPSAVGMTKTPTTGSNNSAKQTVEVVVIPASAIASGYIPPSAQYPHHVQPRSPPQPHSPPQPTPNRRRSGSVPARTNAMMQADRPNSPAKFSHTISRDPRDERKERRKQGRSSDVTVPPIGLTQSYPNHSGPPPYNTLDRSQNHRSPRPPPLPHSNTQPIPSANLPARRPTHRARSHSRANIDDFQYLGPIIGDTSLDTAQTLAVMAGAPEPTRVIRGSRGSSHLTAPSNAEDSVYVSEVVVLDADSWEERGRYSTEGRPKPQRRGSVKKKFADTLESVVRRSPSIHSLKRFSGPPRLGSPSPSSGLPQSSSQQHGHRRSGSRSRSRPATPHTPSHPTYPTSPPLINTNSSNSSHSQGPYSTPALYACEAISPFRLSRNVQYDGIGFHTLDIGTRLWIMKELGHPCMHPALPVHVDDGEDCLLLARDVHGIAGWAFASFLIPVD